MKRNSHLTPLLRSWRALLLGLCLLPGLALADVISTGTTTTTVGGTTTTTAAVQPLNAGPGWSLLGNGLTASTITVADSFADTGTVNTVWKWDAAQVRWLFYAPSMDAATLQSYTASKGYGILSAIAAGEGYWLNTKAAKDFGARSGASPYTISGASLNPGWTLVATGNNLTPAAFISSLGVSVTTLWAWDNASSKWFFYAPSLAAQGGTVLFDYTQSKGYLDFAQQNRTLGNGQGFWINKP